MKARRWFVGWLTVVGITLAGGVVAVPALASPASGTAPASASAPPTGGAPDGASLTGRWLVPRTTSAEGARVSASVQLRAGEPLHDVVVTLGSTGPVSLAVPARQMIGDVGGGSQAQASASFAVTGNGSGTIHATLTGVSATGALIHGAAEVDFATGAHTTVISLSGLLDAQSRALALERTRIGQAAYEQRLAALLGGGASEQFATSRTAPAHGAVPATTKVSGTILYTASDSSKHPSRAMNVEIRDGTPATGSLVAATTTDATGKYSATVSTLRPDKTPRRLFVRVLAQSTGFVIKGVGATLPQHIDSSPHTAAGAPITVSLTANKTADNNTAFDVADALVSAMQYTRQINGGALFANITASFPDPNGTNFNSHTNVARILKLDRFDWDVILHEYGHYVAAQLKIDTSPGGRHSFTQNLGEPPLGKDVGIRLAWSEGFATWFALTAEHQLGVSALKIPRAGDTFYDDTEDASFHVDLNTNSGFPSIGEDNELSVARTLWHFYHDPKLAMPATLILSTLKAAGSDTLSKAVAALLPAGNAAKFNDSEPVDAAKVMHSNDYACVLTDQAVAPEITAPADGTTAQPDTPQTFTWTANGAGPSNRLDRFTVQFWSQTWDKLIFESPAQAATTYTPSMAVWKTIVEGTDATGKVPEHLNVVVKGEGTNAPTTGPYKSCKITEGVEPSIKATPVEAFLSPIPPAPACSGLFPSDINQFVFDGTRLKPRTHYALKFSDRKTGYPDVALGTVTSDANGQVTNQRISIPVMPARQQWPLIATPSGGGTAPHTLVGIAWSSCIVVTGATDVSVQWGGAGVKPKTVVTETWNGAQKFTTTADTKGAYQGSYTIHCASSSNTVQVDATLLDGMSTIVFNQPIFCQTTRSGAPAGTQRTTATAVFGGLSDRGEQFVFRR